MTLDYFDTQSNHQAVAKIVVSLDFPNKILDCDEGLNEILDLNSREVVGRTLRLMFGPSTDLSLIRDAIKQASNEKATSVHTLLYGKSGRSHSVCLSFSPSHTKSETPSECSILLEPVESNKERPTTASPCLSTPLPSKAFAHELVDRICLAQNIPPFHSTRKFRCLRPQTELRYHAYCDDFGPMNLACVVRFAQMLDAELSAHPPTCKLVLCADPGPRALANAAFLLGAYLVLVRGEPAAAVAARFAWLRPPDVEGFRDASFSPPAFTLSLADCWGGLARGRALGWLTPPAAPGGRVWGRVDLAEYERLDDPAIADLNAVVPGEFLALPGPRDLPGGAAFAAHGGGGPLAGRGRFGAGYVAGVLAGLGAAGVVRLCEEAEYDPAAFAARGIPHHDLGFPDCTAPPPAVIAAFFAAADAAHAAGGPLAVHCRAGLGRTGTLVALWLMGRRGFAAREAMGWLRIMRPGSVIGEQQRFLCEVEAASLPGHGAAPGVSCTAVTAVTAAAAVAAATPPPRRL